MRRNLFYALVLMMLVSVQANAVMTPAEQTEPEKLINGGYSEATAEQVMIVKNRVAGEPCEPLYEKKKFNNKFIRFCQRFYKYADPSQDGPERYHHDIQLSPSTTDY